MIKISDSELEIMKIIWKEKEITSAKIINQLKSKEWNNNTIRTFINRLFDKKAIGISKKEGKTYYYVSLVNEDKYKAYLTKKFIDQFFHGSYVEFVEFLIEMNELSYDELCDILEMIDKKIK